ncbi:glycine betaine/L-proline ABC transporter ATP-binding protein [bacterium]|nr:glycine betaine/L-proline ABC transporter ATP-binding protein [bacterium]
METTDAPDNGVPILIARGLWKIFGENPERLFKSDLKNESKEKIQEETGLVVGLRDISFEVQKGEIFVLMGLSGSGKSTLIRVLIRLVDPTAGEIYIGGKEICALSEKELMKFRRRSTAMVFQAFGLLPHYTVLDNAAYGLKIRGVPEEERKKVALEAIKTVGLEGWEDYLPSSLSGGMQQRVGIARALAADPDIMLLDEPFSGLDPLIRRQMQNELIQLQSELHKTMIFVTHDLQEALKIADRIAIMQDGAIIQIGTPEDIIANPVSDYVQEFVQDAYPATVLTAGTIMEVNEPEIHVWQGPKVVHTLIHRSKRDFAFILDKGNCAVGFLNHKALDMLIKDGGDRIDQAMDTEFETCTPEMTVEELFPLATASPHPIAVLDDVGKLVGYIRNHTIIESMIQEWPENGGEDKDV